MAGEPLVRLDFAKIKSGSEGSPVITCRATLDVPRELAPYLGRLDRTLPTDRVVPLVVVRHLEEVVAETSVG